MPTESATPRLSPSGPALAVNSASTIDLTNPGSQFGTVWIHGVGVSGLAAGQVQALSSGGAWHAFRWTPGDGFQDMGTLAGSGDGSVAYGINERGEVVGQSAVANGPDDSFPPHAFRATRPRNYGCPVGSCGFIDLGAQTPNLESIAYAINRNGFVTGRIGNTAVRWGPDNSITYLGDLGGGHSFGRVINSYGTVAGQSTLASGDRRAFRMVNGNMVDLGHLGGFESFAWGINDHGNVVGTSPNGTGENRAFLWTLKTGMRDLGTLGGVSAFAKGINNFNQIIGWSTCADGSAGVFLWTEQEGMMDITPFTGNIPFAAGLSDNLRYASLSKITTLNYTRP